METDHVVELEESMLLNEYITQSNPQIQYKSYQITSGIFHRIRTKFDDLYENTNTPNSQSNLEKFKQA